MIFAGIPLAAYALFAVLSFGTGRSRSSRYRPGQAWPHEPVFYVPHPRVLDDATQALLAEEPGAAQAALTARTQAALPGPAGSDAPPEAVVAPAVGTARGGAHGDW